MFTQCISSGCECFIKYLTCHIINQFVTLKNVMKYRLPKKTKIAKLLYIKLKPNNLKN